MMMMMLMLMMMMMTEEIVPAKLDKLTTFLTRVSNLHMITQKKMKCTQNIPNKILSLPGCLHDDPEEL